MLSVVVIVGLAWAVFFGPTALRAIRKELDRFSGGSISQFNKSLSAFNSSVTDSQMQRRSDGRAGNSQYSDSEIYHHDARLSTFAQNRKKLNREQMLERRRLVLLLMTAFCILTGLLGMVGSLQSLWILTALSGFFIFGYGGLVKYFENLEIEKRKKLRSIQRRPVSTQTIKPVYKNTFGQSDSSVIILGKLSQK